MISVAHAAAEEHAKSAGMPQFEPSMFEHQIVWSILSFLILLYLLKKHVLPAINDLLDARASKIEDDLNAASQARQEADKIQADLHSQSIIARQMASEALEQARLDATHHRENAMEELSAELNKKKSAAVEEIEAAKKKALAEVQSVVVEVAIMATEKLIAKTVNTATANSMVEQALKEIEASKTSLH